jgi:transposase
MAKYTEQFRLSIIKEYEASPNGYRDLARRHGLDASTIRKWVCAYREHGVAGVERKYQHYSLGFKQLVLQQIHSEGLSDRQAAARFNIRNLALVGLWKRQYDEGGSSGLMPRPPGRPRKMPKEPITPPAELDDDARSRQELLDELSYLRMENAYLKKLEALVQAQRQAAQRKKPKS